MKVFVSYSFRPENDWVGQHVIPLLECFGHQPLTGRILQAGALSDEVRRTIKQCRKILCFVTRGERIYDSTGGTANFHPPEWVRDELMLARGAGRDALEFREIGVKYGGESPFHAYCEFSRDRIPDLLVDVARRVQDWPVGPLQLKLAVPDEFRPVLEQAALAGTLHARCVAVSVGEDPDHAEDLKVQIRDGQLIAPFWVKPTPHLAIEIEITIGAQRLVCKGISPAVREARLAAL